MCVPSEFVRCWRSIMKTNRPMYMICSIHSPCTGRHCYFPSTKQQNPRRHRKKQTDPWHQPLATRYRRRHGMHGFIVFHVGCLLIWYQGLRLGCTPFDRAYLAVFKSLLCWIMIRTGACVSLPLLGDCWLHIMHTNIGSKSTNQCLMSLHSIRMLAPFSMLFTCTALRCRSSQCPWCRSWLMLFGPWAMMLSCI